MLTRTSILRASIALAAFALGDGSVVAQSPQQQRPVNPGQMKPVGGQPGQAKPAINLQQPAAIAASGQQSDAARKEAILHSERWRRAMFEMDEWLSAQPYYTKPQIEQIKANLAAQVAKMSPADLESMLADMDAKIQIMETPQAQEARAWLAQYLSVLSTKKREEVLQRMPNLSTMSAAQLSEEIGQLQQRRAANQQTEAAFQKGQQQQVQAVLQANRMAQQSYNRDITQAAASPSYSPYRTPPLGEKPFSDYNENTGPRIFVDPYGQVGFMFPSSW